MTTVQDWLRRATAVDWFLLALRVVVVAVVGTGFVAGLLNPRYAREEWFSFLAFGLTIGAMRGWSASPSTKNSDMPESTWVT